jgi:hypothetical protein
VFWAIPPDRLNNDVAGLASKIAETVGHLEQADRRTFAACAAAAEEANKAVERGLRRDGLRKISSRCGNG